QNCAVYLYPDERSATAGESFGGSGFLLMHHETDANYHQIYVITNTHVIKSGACAIRINTRVGGFDVIPTDEAEWHKHPTDDLAAYPVKLDINIYQYALLTPLHFATRSVIERFNIGIGDDCFVVGRFVNHAGRQKNQPSARFGNIAQMPGDPIDGGSHVPQE